MVDFEQWEGFEGSLWKEEVNVRDFIQKNYTVYDGDESFLAGPTDATNKLWGILQGLQKEERAKGGVLDMETKVVSGITSYGPGYISEADKDLEKVVGLQTDKPLCLSAVSRWLSRLAQHTVTSRILNFIKFSQNIARHITRVYLMLTLLKCLRLVTTRLLQVFLILTDVAVS